MTRKTLNALTMGAALLASASAPLHAQGGGLGSLLGGVLPNVRSVGASNAAGILSYCVKNKLLTSVGGATGILGQLSGQDGVKTSDAFKLGQTGTIQTDNSRLSIDSLKGKVKTSLCDMVLKHAKTFL